MNKDLKPLPSKVEHLIEQAEQRCSAHGSRLTIKRKQVLTSLLLSEKALSAYELIDLCKVEYGEALPATSMYRILEFLEGEELVHRLNLSNKYVACSHISCEHDHGAAHFLICRKCNKVKEVNIKSSTLTDLQAAVTESGFELVSQQLEMNCQCNECADELL